MNMKRFLSTSITILLLIIVAMPALAQTGNGYDLTWSTVDDSGSSYSSGNGYWLGGTTGQSDAGELTGGSYSLVGGFWQVKQEYPTVVSLIKLGAGNLRTKPWSSLFSIITIIVGMVLFWVVGKAAYKKMTNKP
jgi:hypothetical protein